MNIQRINEQISTSYSISLASLQRFSSLCLLAPGHLHLMTNEHPMLSRSSVELGKPKPVLPRAHEQYYTHLQSPGFSVRSAKSPLTLPSLLPPHPFSKIYPSPAVASLDCPPLLCVVIHISIFCVFDVLMGGRHAFLPLQAHSPIVLPPT